MHASHTENVAVSVLHYPDDNQCKTAVSQTHDQNHVFKGEINLYQPNSTRSLNCYGIIFPRSQAKITITMPTAIIHQMWYHAPPQETNRPTKRIASIVRVMYLRTYPPRREAAYLSRLAYLITIADATMAGMNPAKIPKINWCIQIRYVESGKTAMSVANLAGWICW